MCSRSGPEPRLQNQSHPGPPGAPLANTGGPLANTGGPLAYTGANGVTGFLVLGLVLLIGGAGALFLRRRTRADG
ncbi:LPXTG cell wall anchor domain-containing protein [Arthrobacter sp. 24S4-2]|nr:LPXTG cell wall anchor domain-containing protein [Arthrobacter sp. 24S4-2]